MNKCEHNMERISRELCFGWDGDKIQKVTYKCTSEGCKKKKVRKFWNGSYIGHFDQ